MDEKLLIELATKAALWAGGTVVLLLGYFLRDAHKNFKDGLEKKADREVIDNAFRVYRSDMHAMEERHKEETARMERQYEIRFAGVIHQFTERINSMEHNINGKIDMVLNVVNRRHE